MRELIGMLRTLLKLMERQTLALEKIADASQPIPPPFEPDHEIITHRGAKRAKPKQGWANG